MFCFSTAVNEFSSPPNVNPLILSQKEDLPQKSLHGKQEKNCKGIRD